MKRYGKCGRKASWIIKRYEQYGRNPNWTVKRYEKYGGKTSRIDKRFEKYRRQLWKDMENTEENSENIRKLWKKDKSNR